MESNSYVCAVCGCDPCQCARIANEDWLNIGGWRPEDEIEMEIHEHGRD